MPEGYKPIPRCQEGGVSLISSDYANKLIDVINAFGSGKVAPIANVGQMLLSGGQFILDLSVLDQRLRAIETAGLAANISALQNNVTILQNNVTTINNRLNNASISANGSCTGNNITINVSLNI